MNCSIPDSSLEGPCDSWSLEGVWDLVSLAVNVLGIDWYEVSPYWFNRASSDSVLNKMAILDALKICSQLLLIETRVVSVKHVENNIYIQSTRGRVSRDDTMKTDRRAVIGLTVEHINLNHE